jgi:type IV pilus assembly protein PilC
MITYKYVARNTATGEKIRSEVQADNKKNASILIQSLGYVPIEIKEEDATKSPISRFLTRVKTKDKIVFSNQLSALLNAGLPLVQSLRSVQEQTKNKHLKAITGQIISDIESGKPLSEALAKHPEVFSTIYVSLVSAGETSGTLDKSLERLSAQQEKDADIVSKVRGAMVYPIIIGVVMVGVVVFMMLKVIPEVEKIYASFDEVKLPWITNVLISMSRASVKYWWVLLIIFILFSVFFGRWTRTLKGKSKIDRLKLIVPPINQLMIKMYMARFTRTAYTLVGAGVPLLQVLEVTSRSLNNVVIERSLNLVIEKVKGGKSLSEALSVNPYFLDLVPKMIKIGEQSGSLDTMLGKTADFYEKEVDNQIKNISTIIEPAMMIILGVLALIIVAAVLLPIYGLAGQSLAT